MIAGLGRVARQGAQLIGVDEAHLEGHFLDAADAEALPQLDGLLLSLHGAMVAEGFPQADGEIVRRVRQLVGPDFPVVVTHDYHGNVPAQLVQDATALIIYKTCPHIDQPERGLQAAELIARTVRGEIKPTSAIVKPEVLFNIAFHNTSSGPMKPLMDAAIALEDQPGVLAVSIAIMRSARARSPPCPPLLSGSRASITKSTPLGSAPCTDAS